MSRTFEHSAVFEFYDDLNDLLQEGRETTIQVYRFHGNPSVKDAIEAQGIPHTEVDLIVVNGRSVGFGYHLESGDIVRVHPDTSDERVSGNKELLRGEPEKKFILDVHLGKLARLIRLAGFDALYRNDYSDHEIAETSAKQGRIVLTRDRRLLKFSKITHGYWIRSFNPEEQLKEVVGRFKLSGSISPFNRCLECNGEIVEVDKNSVIDQLEPKTRIYYDSFYRCKSCLKIYWRGSHYSQMKEMLEEIRF